VDEVVREDDDVAACNDSEVEDEEKDDDDDDDKEGDAEECIGSGTRRTPTTTSDKNAGFTGG
jgi:hypothetical protein